MDLCDFLIRLYLLAIGLGSVVGIATGYGLDGPRIVSRFRFMVPYIVVIT